MTKYKHPTEPQQPGREMRFSEKLQIMSTLKQELSAHLVGAHCCSEFNENIWCCSSLTSNAVPTRIGVTVFLIYGLCTQDLTRLQAKQICGWEATDQQVGAALSWNENKIIWKFSKTTFASHPSIAKKLPPESMWKTRLRIRIWVFMSWHIRREAQW